MRGHLIRIDSVHRDGEALPLFLASVDAPELCHIDGQQWEPNIARLPSLRYDFFGGSFDGQITAPSGTFSVSIDGIDSFAERVFANARIQLYTGEVGATWSDYELLFDGLITSEPEIREGLASFTMGVDAAWLDTPLLALYEGTGGIDGDADMIGRVKFLTFGNTRFADAVLIDPVDLIYQVHDGAIQGVVAAYDRVQALPSSTGDYANLVALEAASIPAGGWGTCKALGLVRLGAPPDGRVAFDVQGGGSYARLPGDIIAAVADIAGGTIDADNLAALDVARPYNLQVQIAAQTTARAVIQSIADSIGAVAGVSWLGKLFVQPLAIDADPAETLAAVGTSDIAVAEVTALSIAAPYWRLAVEAEPTYVVYGLGEVASGYTFRGAYAAATVYRIDDLVFASDGRSFVYINATPGAGNAPPAMPTTSNSYWSLEGAATVGAPTGTTVAGRDADMIADAINASGEIVDAAIITVGGRDAGDVASTVAAGGGVDTDQVSTDSIVDNAVSATGFAFTASGTLLNTSYTNVQSLAVTADGVSPVILQFALAYYWSSDNGKGQCALYRDTTALVALDEVTVNSGENPTMSGIYVDYPAAGTYTYYLKAKANNTNKIGSKNNALVNLELKK